MFRRSAALECGNVTELFRSVEDYDFNLRILKHGKGANIAHPLIKYRIHRRSIKSVATKRQLQETIALRQRAITEYAYVGSPKVILFDAMQRTLLLLPAPVIRWLFRTVFYRH